MQNTITSLDAIQIQQSVKPSTLADSHLIGDHRHKKKPIATVCTYTVSIVYTGILSQSVAIVDKHQV